MASPKFTVTEGRKAITDLSRIVEDDAKARINYAARSPVGYTQARDDIAQEFIGAEHELFSCDTPYARKCQILARAIAVVAIDEFVVVTAPQGAEKGGDA